MAAETRAGVALCCQAPRTIPVIALGWASSLFLAITYVLCVAGYLQFPALPINHAALTLFLSGFTLLTWSSFFIGLVECLAYGWFVALVFGPLYNHFATRSA